jgi:uncharacterized oxidoreductase
MDITTRSVFMVGGTSGIGLELARRFRAAGSSVVVGGRRTAVLAQLAEEGLGIVEIDVTDADSVTRRATRCCTRTRTSTLSSPCRAREGLRTSGIGFLPFPLMPTYGASKTAVHAYSEALRAQLAGTGVEVAELVPPAVAWRVGGSNPHALALDAYGAEVMDLVAQDPTPHEILVLAVLMHRWAERDGTYDDLVAQRSRALAMLPGRSQG